LTAHPGPWGGVSSFGYDWQRCDFTACVPTGGTGATYVITRPDVGYLLRVVLTPAAQSGPEGVCAETQVVKGM
jgi:hypothetical protein